MFSTFCSNLKKGDLELVRNSAENGKGRPQHFACERCRSKKVSHFKYSVQTMYADCEVSSYAAADKAEAVTAAKCQTAFVSTPRQGRTRGAREHAIRATAAKARHVKRRKQIQDPKRHCISELMPHMMLCPPLKIIASRKAVAK